MSLLESLGIKYDKFTEKYFHYDPNRKIHISESEFGFVWISTAGLVARKKETDSSAVNACMVQYEVVSLLFKKAIEVVKDEKVYDIDSFSSGYLSRLSPAIFQNLTFYIEVLCKAYLSLTNTQYSYTHKLASLYQTTVNAMFARGHNDSLFQVMVLDPLYNYVSHIQSIPGNFKEHNIKYDDNPMDDTVILFEINGLIEMTHLLEVSVDFISDFYYDGTDSRYLKSNLFQKLLDKADTEEKKEKINRMYSHLIR